MNSDLPRSWVRTDIRGHDFGGFAVPEVAHGSMFTGVPVCLRRPPIDAARLAIAASTLLSVHLLAAAQAFVA